MAIRESIEIARPPQDVFAYATDPARLTEWQENLVEAKVQTEGPTRIGSRVTQTRRVGGGTRTFTLEVTAHEPPSRFAFKGIGGLGAVARGDHVRTTRRRSAHPVLSGVRGRGTWARRAAHATRPPHSPEGASREPPAPKAEAGVALALSRRACELLPTVSSASRPRWRAARTIEHEHPECALP